MGRRETNKEGESQRGNKWRTDDEKAAHSHFHSDHKLLQTKGKFLSLIFYASSLKRFEFSCGKNKEHKEY